MTKPALISVIVPIYNVSKYLRRCLDSIASQTYENLEIILINDGSTDDSGKIAEEYAKKDKRARVIHQKNGGLSSARNAGLKIAHGEFVVFVDSDDYIDPGCIENLHDTAQKSDADIATCRFESFSEDNLRLKRSPVSPKLVMAGRESAADLLTRSRPAYIWTSIFRRSLFTDNNIEFPDGRTYEDLATRFRLEFFAKKVAYTNQRLYHYLMRRSSITGTKFSESRFNDILFAVKSIKDFNTKQEVVSPRFVNYYELKTLMFILNSLAREDLLDKSLNKYWKDTVSRLRASYRQVEFPSIHSRFVYTALLMVAHSRVLYGLLYRLKRLTR